MGRFFRRKNLNILSSAFSLAKRRSLVSDDYYAVSSDSDCTIAIVCDGVGSAAAGGEAAKRTVNYIINNFKIRPKTWSIEKSIKTFVKSINSMLYNESINSYEREELLTTLALVVIQGERLYGVNIGDSRIYLYREDKLTQLSIDHIDQEYAHTLTQAIGSKNDIQMYYFENIISKGDKILLCSDGLYNTLNHNYLKENISLGAHLLVKKASHLSNDDLADDTTAILLDILKIDEITILKEQNIKIAQTLKISQNIDGYELLKPFNKNTWLCIKKSKEYVIKFAPKEAGQNDEILDLFVKEAWNAKRLKSSFFPNAVIPKNRTHRYYIMKFINGETLDNFLSKKTLSVDDTVKLAKTLLSMSQYLLKYDLVHGDIKPQNIILQKDAQEINFKIIDFGNITEIFSISSRAGTPSFLSPERFNNEAISESSEIFSIGVTLYLALTQRYPYNEIEPFQTPIFKEAKKPSLYNSNIPQWLDSVILRSISPNSDKRYSHYSQMMHELNNPQKVEPYFVKDSFFLQIDQTLFYKRAFAIMLIINIMLLLIK